LRIFDELTSTVPALVVLLAPVASAVLRDIVRPTGRTGHLNRHRADFLVIVMVSPNFPLSRAIMHYQQGDRYRREHSRHLI